MTLNTIVVLLDLTRGTRNILDCAKSMANAFRSRLVLLHVSPPQSFPRNVGSKSSNYLFEPSLEHREDQWTRLCEIRESLVSSGVEVETDQILQIPREKVLAECHRLRADLIVMGSHHRGILEPQPTRGTEQQDSYPAFIVPTNDHSGQELPDLERSLPEVGEAPNPFAIA